MCLDAERIIERLPDITGKIESPQDLDVSEVAELTPKKGPHSRFIAYVFGITQEEGVPHLVYHRTFSPGDEFEPLRAQQKHTQKPLDNFANYVRMQRLWEDVVI